MCCCGCGPGRQQWISRTFADSVLLVLEIQRCAACMHAQDPVAAMDVYSTAGNAQHAADVTDTRHVAGRTLADELRDSSEKSKKLSAMDVYASAGASKVRVRCACGVNDHFEQGSRKPFRATSVRVISIV